jgi:UDPglucose--hexose-1-phosphate uridylyltransferase
VRSNNPVELSIGRYVGESIADWNSSKKERVMPELRKDPIVDRWVIMAPERANRPIAIREGSSVVHAGFDPFAEGNEAATTREILAYREQGSAPDGPGWRVRVVPNKYPALQTDGIVEERTEGIYKSVNGVGAHEVIIECPQDEKNLSRLSVENVREILTAYIDRLLDLKRDPQHVHALIFKNQGLLAGASLMHAHSQLIATPLVPITITQELQGALEYFNFHGRSIFRDMVGQELATGSRIVLRDMDCAQATQQSL